MSDRVSISIQDGVADVRLARPEKMNALDPAMFDALSAAGERLKGVEAVVANMARRPLRFGILRVSASIGATSATIGAYMCSVISTS